MKKNSKSEFKQREKKMDKKEPVILSLNEYRKKKQKAQSKKSEHPEANKNITDKTSIFSIEAYKKKNKYFEKSQHVNSKSINSTKQNKKIPTKIISLAEYKKRKTWKKEWFVNTSQVASMSFLFLFMFMYLVPNFKNSNSGSSNWFEAPSNKGIVISSSSREIASDDDPTRDPSNLLPACDFSKEDDPIKAMKKINRKNKDCLVQKF